MKADFKWCEHCDRENCPNKDNVKISGGCIFFNFFDFGNLRLMYEIECGRADVPAEFVR